MIQSKGNILKLLSYAISAILLLLFGLWDSSGLNSVLEIILFFIAFFFSIIFVVVLHQTGRAYKQNEQKAPLNIVKSLVLYLRLFKDDEVTSEFKLFGLTEEEQLVNVLENIGPVIALDSPQKRYSIPGATRHGVDNKKWKDEIIDLLNKAQIVAIRLGRSPAIDWEIKQIKSFILPKQVLIIIPKLEIFNYNEFKAYYESNLQFILPEICRINKHWFLPNFSSLFSIEGFVYFNYKWEGSFSRPKFTFGSWLRSPLMQPGTASIKLALKPVFYNLGIPFVRPTIKLVPLLIIIIFSAVIILGILGKSS